MPDVEYRIVIDEGGTQKKSVVANSSVAQQGVGAWSYIAYKKAAPYVKQIVSHEISQINVRTGRSEYQQQVQFAYNAVSGLIDMGENIAVGFATGGGVGAVIAAALTVASKTVSFLQKVQEVQTEQRIENISLGMRRERAGASWAATNQSRR